MDKFEKNDPEHCFNSSRPTVVLALDKKVQFSNFELFTKRPNALTIKEFPEKKKYPPLFLPYF